MGITNEAIANFLLFFPILLISVAIHEFAHCWTNDRLGDDTPRLNGRLTLNPIAHLDPIGTIMMALAAFSGFGFGWGKSSPFNPVNFRHPARDRMIGAFAGPFSNILQMLAWASIGLIVSIFISFDPGSADFSNWPVPFKMCLYGMIINSSLAVFNLLPIYPLDGHHILCYLAPRSWRPVIDNPMWGFVFLAIVLYKPLRHAILDPVLDPVLNGLFRMAMALVGWP